jgi:hypothetical protein
MRILLYGGAILVLVGWVWNVAAAFKMGGALWGVLNLFLQPLVGIISAAMKKTQWVPVGLMIVGLIVFLASGGWSMINR